MEDPNASNKTNGKYVLYLLILQGAVLIHALAGVFSKLASGHPFLSWDYLLPFGTSLFLTFLYALFWQTALKRIPLISAFFLLFVGTVWTALFGVLIFHEQLTAGKIFGLVLVVLGALLVVTGNE